MDKIIKNISKTIYETMKHRHSESIYQNCFSVELTNRAMPHAQEVNISIKYKSVDVGFCRLDIIIYNNNEPIIIEFKAVAKLTSKERDQMIKYLTHYDNSKIGYLINFGSKNGAEIFKFEKNNNITYTPLL